MINAGKVCGRKRASELFLILFRAIVGNLTDFDQPPSYFSQNTDQLDNID